ncbi:MAG: SCO family protein, partial [Bacteroidia bacterium]|nr:SCO family protein [Bacteroidia bacterium]
MAEVNSSSSPSNYTRILAILAVLAGPIIAIFLLRSGKHSFKTLPIIGEYQVSGTDTIYHTIWDSVSTFQFRDHENQVFTPDSVKGQIHVADFFFTTCPGVCKTLSSQMQKLQQKLKEKEIPEVKLVSYSIDPEADSVPVLQAYASAHKALYPQWKFVTGDQQTIFKLAIRGYLQAAVKTPEGQEKITHSPMMVLVDNKSRIRGFYNA